MTPQDLAQASIVAMSQTGNSHFEDVVYKGTTYKAIVKDGKTYAFKDTEDTDSIAIQDKKTFIDVNLPNGISRTHIISYNSDDWSVVDYIKKMNSLYDVYVTRTKFTGNTPKSRR